MVTNPCVMSKEPRRTGYTNALPEASMEAARQTFGEQSLLLKGSLQLPCSPLNCHLALHFRPLPHLVFSACMQTVCQRNQAHTAAGAVFARERERETRTYVHHTIVAYILSLSLTLQILSMCECMITCIQCNHIAPLFLVYVT